MLYRESVSEEYSLKVNDRMKKQIVFLVWSNLLQAD